LLFEDVSYSGGHAVQRPALTRVGQMTSDM
jgi:hypothetical protein